MCVLIHLCVFSNYYMCVLALLHVRPRTATCVRPQTTTCVSSYCYMSALLPVQKAVTQLLIQQVPLADLLASMLYLRFTYAITSVLYLCFTYAMRQRWYSFWHPFDTADMCARTHTHTFIKLGLYWGAAPYAMRLLWYSVWASCDAARALSSLSLSVIQRIFALFMLYSCFTHALIMLYLCFTSCFLWYSVATVLIQLWCSVW